MCALTFQLQMQHETLGMFVYSQGEWNFHDTCPGVVTVGVDSSLWQDVWEKVTEPKDTCFLVVPRISPMPIHAMDGDNAGYTMSKTKLDCRKEVKKEDDDDVLQTCVVRIHQQM
jgi:hypothetical protein